jgi:hypothetical protein
MKRKIKEILLVSFSVLAILALVIVAVLQELKN